MYKIITEQSSFEELMKELKKEEFLGIDTEFIREEAYIPELCLIQISTLTEIYIIDPIGLDLKSFLRIWEDESILKIMHSCTQDIDIIYKNFEILPKNIFDLQIAASFLGHGDAISYAKLVFNILKKTVEKNSKLTNWKKRPLTESQLEYAALDVKYLYPIYKKLSSSLEVKKYKEWVLEETKSIYNKENYAISFENAWRKITKSTSDLDYLKPLATMREEEAFSRDIPRKKILKDDILLHIAKTKPKNSNDLKQDRILNRVLNQKQIEEIGNICSNIKIEKKEEEKKKLNISKNGVLICDLLKTLLKYVSNQHKIASKNIAKSEDIERFVKEKTDIIFLSGWRYEIYGKLAEEFINGEISFAINEKKYLTVKKA